MRFCSNKVDFFGLQFEVAEDSYISVLAAMSMMMCCSLQDGLIVGQI